MTTVFCAPHPLDPVGALPNLPLGADGCRPVVADAADRGHTALALTRRGDGARLPPMDALEAKAPAARAALELLPDAGVIGLGTGSTSLL